MEPLLQWEDAAADELAREWGVPAVHLFARVGSTNDVARALAETGAASGSAVLAEEQLAGRGQHGRAWASPPGLGVWLSGVLRPAANPALLPLRVGIHAARALDRFTHPATPRLKWPNDLLVRGKKLGGILCESVWGADGPTFSVVGIGVNVLHRTEDFSPGLRPGAISLAAVSASPPQRREVAGALVGAMLSAAAEREITLGPDEVAELERRDALRGHEVVANAAGAAPLRGTAVGIAPDGALLVRIASGALRSIRSGSVRLAEAPSNESANQSTAASPAENLPAAGRAARSALETS